VFQKLERLKGDWDSISSRIVELSATDSQGWLEVIYEGDEVIGDLRERLEATISGTQMEILRITITASSTVCWDRSTKMKHSTTWT
jgi:exonuclease SbcD